MLKRVFMAVVFMTVASGVTIAAQDAKQVELGKKLYETYNCKKCHKIGDVGKLTTLDGVASKLSEEDLRKWLVSPDEMTAKLKKKPKVKMKKQLDKPGEVEAMMAYLLTLK